MIDKEKINICFFDINGEYSEEAVFDQNKNFLNLESPIQIISQYITDNFVQNLSKSESKDKYITKFIFSEKIRNILFNFECDVICNFSVSHQSTFDSNGYIIFCDLEKSETLNLLEKIINYISENCSIFIKTYIIGVFKDHIDENKTYNKMKELLQNIDNEIEFDYYEMYLGEKDKFTEIKNIYKDAKNLDDVFKDIFLKIYKDIATNDGKVIIEKGFGADRSGLLCKIF